VHNQETRYPAGI